MKPFRYLLLAAVTLVTGCAQLQVHVDVLDPVYAREAIIEAGLREDLDRLLNRDLSQEENLISDLTANYMRARRAAFEKLRPLVSNGPNEAHNNQVIDRQIARVGDVNALGTEFRKRIREVDQQAAAQFNQITLSRVSSTDVAAPATPLTPGLRTFLLIRRAEMTRYTADIAQRVAHLEDQVKAVVDNFEAAAKAERPSAKAAVEASGEKVTAASGQIIDSGVKANDRLATHTIFGGGLSLASNPAAFAATSQLSEGHWAPVYNRALGLGIGGGTDIAIKLNGAADFTVKGFVFDGRSTAQMVSKVGTRAVSLIAAAYGAPFATTSGSGGKQTVAFDPAHQISPASETLAGATAETAAYRAALFHVADSILGGVADDGTVSVSAPATVRAAFDNRTRKWLTPPSATGAGTGTPAPADTTKLPPVKLDEPAAETAPAPAVPVTPATPAPITPPAADPSSPNGN